MSETHTASTTPSGRLRRGSIGVPGMAFMVVAIAAPLTAMAANLSLSLGLGVGVGTLGWILLIGALLAAYTAGYAVLARTVVSAGAYYAYISHGLGRTVGAAAATVAFIGYNLATAGLLAATAYFTDLAVVNYWGIDVPWPLYASIGLMIIAAVSYFGAGAASKLAMIVSLLQFGLLAALAIAVVADRPSALNLEGFSPSTWQGTGLSLTIVFLLLSFAGYEAAAAYGEECEAPDRKIKQATYLALGLLLVVFLVSTWTLIAAFDDVRAVASADPGSLLVVAAVTYLGPTTAHIITATVAVSFLAAALAIHNMAARYGFALGRAGLLPRAMSKTHPDRGVPHVAIAVQVVTTVAILAPFVLLGADPLVNLLPSVSGLTALATVSLLTTCSISVIVASARGRVAGNPLATRILPTIAIAGFTVITVLIVRHYGEVTGSDAPAVAAMPLILVAGALAGAVVSRRATGEITVS